MCVTFVPNIATINFSKTEPKSTYIFAWFSQFSVKFNNILSFRYDACAHTHSHTHTHTNTHTHIHHTLPRTFLLICNRMLAYVNWLCTIILAEIEK